MVSLMKVNKPTGKSNNDDEKTIPCPACKSELLRVRGIKVNDTLIALYDDIGVVYQCTNPECEKYYLTKNSSLVEVTKLELLKMQNEITNLMQTQEKASQAAMYPTAYEQAVKAELGRSLSRILWTLTIKTKHHRDYTVEELYEACKALGFNPLDVDNDLIPIVLTWLKEHKD